MSGAYRDREEVLRAQLEALGEHRGALIDRRRGVDDDLAALDVEIAEIEARLPTTPRPTRSRYLWVLVAGATATVGACATALVATAACTYPRPKLESAQVGATMIRQAAELYVNLDVPAVLCPTLDDLVVARKLDRQKGSDPWGRPFHIECADDEIRVWSAGKDGLHRTADDIADDFKPSDMRRVAALQ